MLLQLPAMDDAGVTMLSVCGRINTKSKKLKDWAHRHSKEIYYYEPKPGSKNIPCHVLLDRMPGFVHVHFDLEHDVDTKSKKGKKKTLKEQIGIDDLIRPFLEQKVEASVVGRFVLKPKELPTFVRAVGKISLTHNDLNIKLSGCEFSIEGSPITTIAWRERDKQDTIEVSGRKSLEFSASYLVECLDFVSSYSELIQEA